MLETVAAIDETAVLDLVEQGMNARLLAEVPGDDAVRFAHALIREALYEGLPGIQRRRIHRRVGETLAASVIADADAVANHFQRAHDARAVEWLIAAGERAENANAHLTAAGRYEAALALIPETVIDERGWLLYRIARLRLPGDLRYINEAVRLAEAADDRVLSAVTRYHRGYARCHHGARRAGLAELEAGADVVTPAAIMVRAARASPNWRRGQTPSWHSPRRSAGGS